jgi:DNA repair exonuclease SbcCD ATPase subunit
MVRVTTFFILLLLHHSQNFVHCSSPNKSGGSWIGNLLGVNINENEDDKQSLNPSPLGGTSSSFPPPPPPPPPSLPQHNKNDENDNNDAETRIHEEDTIKNQQTAKLPHRPWGLSNDTPLPPPPPSQFDSSSSQQQQQQQQPPLPPQQSYPDDWHMHQMYISQQQQHQNQYQQQYQKQPDDETIQSLQADIDSLLSHQNNLYNTIHNLTMTIQDNDQMLQFQLNQIDVLLEQVADAEAYASAESNAALEYKQNCTDLSENIHELQLKVDELEGKCKNMEESERCHLEDIEKLKNKLKKKEKELENLACGVEMARLEQQKEKYKEKMEKKKRKKSRGLVSWLFDCIFLGNNGNGSMDEDDTDDEVEKLQVCFVPNIMSSCVLHEKS